MAYIQKFYDSDEELGQEIDNADEDFMKFKVQERTNPNIEEFESFLKEPSFITPKGDPNTRLINLHTGLSYDIPGNKINKFFDHLERIRRTRAIGLKWEERQYYEGCEYSGIMIDLDIYQESVTDQFNQCTFNLLFQHIAVTLKQYLQLEKYKQDNLARVHVAILRRPKISRKTDDEPYKDGLHILIPGVKVRKEVKKLLIYKFSNPDADFFKVINIVKAADYRSADYKAHTEARNSAVAPASQSSSATKIGAHNIVDKGSATAPVFLYGCERRDDRQPYVLQKLIEINYPVVGDRIMDPMISDITHNYYYFDMGPAGVVGTRGTPPSNWTAGDEIKMPTATKTSLWIQELSLHWEVAQGTRTNPVIRKYNYEVRPEYRAEADRYVSRPEMDFKESAVYGELDIRRLNDAETDFYQALLDTLSPRRAESYDSWFDVLCVLAHAKGNNKPLAKYFSQKCPKKYNETDFERFWNQAKNVHKKVLNVGSLCFWAQQDNPERYKEVCNRNVHTKLLKVIFNGISEGFLGHYDVAELVHACVPYKYIYTTDYGGLWYECITDEDDHRDGETYKWRPVSTQPSSLRNYISYIVSDIFSHALKTINMSYTKATDPQEVKYYYNIMKNFKMTCRKLKDSAFKSAVVRESQDLYVDRNFTDKLDKCPTVLPVANGIIVLGERVRLIRGYHNYIVSKFSPTVYVPFDPRNPMIKKVLYLYRNLFPDSQPDTHEFFMSLYASSLDGRPKDQIFCMKIGGGKNGKTMTTEIHRNMLGNVFAITLAIQFITGNQKRDAESSSPATMKAEYARHIDYQESDKCETLASSKMKLITGNGTIGGRENYGEYRNFKLNCNHVVDTNHEFKINDNSFGVWRRMKYIEMPMRFHGESEMADFDPKNPYHRVAENVDVLQNDPEFMSAYLAVLTWYYERLQVKYKGSVQNVPHPHIQKNTLAYRDSQNKLSMFYTKFLIRCNEEERNSRLLIDEIRGRYERWYRTIGVVDNAFRDSIESDIKNSIIAGLIQKDPYGPCDYILGYRLREFNDADELKDGELRFVDPSQKRSAAKIEIKPETWEEYYAKVCREYDEVQQTYLQDIKLGDDNGPKDLMSAASIFSGRKPTLMDRPPLPKTPITDLAKLHDVIDETEFKEQVKLNAGPKYKSAKRVSAAPARAPAKKETVPDSAAETSDGDSAAETSDGDSAAETSDGDSAAETSDGDSAAETSD